MHPSRTIDQAERRGCGIGTLAARLLFLTLLFAAAMQCERFIHGQPPNRDRSHPPRHLSFEQATSTGPRSVWYTRLSFSERSSTIGSRGR